MANLRDSGRRRKRKKKVAVCGKSEFIRERERESDVATQVSKVFICNFPNIGCENVLIGKSNSPCFVSFVSSGVITTDPLL